ncbi:unnamed protein product [Moneuplotes crassus]|uniref:Uncharacterized protein n=1 Tax=Euplotes crassus TaxID=5936 RepID=A0AAD1U5D2_EUPCR|nr:unnamed protein product [Moneuplotes crassus]
MKNCESEQSRSFCDLVEYAILQNETGKSQVKNLGERCERKKLLRDASSRHSALEECDLGDDLAGKEITNIHPIYSTKVTKQISNPLVHNKGRVKLEHRKSLKIRATEMEPFCKRNSVEPTLEEGLFSFRNTVNCESSASGGLGSPASQATEAKFSLFKPKSKFRRSKRFISKRRKTRKNRNNTEMSRSRSPMERSRFRILSTFAKQKPQP